MYSHHCNGEFIRFCLVVVFILLWNKSLTIFVFLQNINFLFELWVPWLWPLPPFLSDQCIMMNRIKRMAPLDTEEYRVHWDTGVVQRNLSF